MKQFVMIPIFLFGVTAFSIDLPKNHTPDFLRTDLEKVQTSELLETQRAEASKKSIEARINALDKAGTMRRAMLASA